MKAVKISVTHGRIWVVETSSGVRAQGASLVSAFDHILKPDDAVAARDALEPLFDLIPDTGDHGIARKGQASA